MTPNKFLISDGSYDEKSKDAGIGVIDLFTSKHYMQKLQNCPSSQYAMTLDVRIFDKHLIGKIKFYQFLWLKREYLHEADRLAKKAHELQKIIYVEQVSNIVQSYRSYSDNKKLKSMLLIANNEQKQVLRAFIDKKYHAGCMLSQEDLSFFRTVYGLIQNNKLKKKFLRYLDRHSYVDIYTYDIYKKCTQEHYKLFIHTIFDSYRDKQKKKKKIISF